MISPGEVMNVVRELWRNEVCASAAKETNPDAAVVRAFRDARTRLEASEDLGVREAVELAVHSTDEWKSEHEQMVRDMYLSVHDTEIGDDELGSLANMTDGEKIAEKIVDMTPSKQGAAREVSPAPNEVTASDGVAEEVQSAEQVDECWLHAFAEAYGRDAYVHEYVLVRDMGGDLVRHARTHREAFDGLRAVHTQYLGEDLSESDFVKTYIPRALTQTDIVGEVRTASIKRPKYRQAMVARLSHLHAVLCGAELAEDEATFLFEREVLDKRLPLDTDALNDVVTDFVMHGESLRTVIKGLYGAYLGRDAELDEVDEWLFDFRKTLDDSKSLLRKQLCECHEFHAVIIDMIKSNQPDLRTSDMFRLLDKALTTADFMLIDTVSDLYQALKSCGVLASA